MLTFAYEDVDLLRGVLRRLFVVKDYTCELSP